MEFWINYFLTLSFFGYICLFVLISGIYIVIIAPFLFNFWIIPKIENRYKTKLRIKEEDYPCVPFASWNMPSVEISAYIFFKYINCLPRGFKKPSRNGTVVKQLYNLNYNIKTASSSELVMSFITILLFIIIIIFGVIIFLDDKVLNHALSHY